MKMKQYFMGGLLGISTVVSIQSAPECIDNSWHLTRPNDDKNYHAVCCYCPCGSHSPSGRYTIIDERGLCTQCGHCRVVRPVSTLVNPFSSLSTKKTAPTKCAHILKAIFSMKGTKKNTAV